MVGHLSRDPTAIEAREKPVRKVEPPELTQRKQGRPKKGEQRPKELKGSPHLKDINDPRRQSAKVTRIFNRCHTHGFIAKSPTLDAGV